MDTHDKLNISHLPIPNIFTHKTHRQMNVLDSKLCPKINLADIAIIHAIFFSDLPFLEVSHDHPSIVP